MPEKVQQLVSKLDESLEAALLDLPGQYETPADWQELLDKIIGTGPNDPGIVKKVFGEYHEGENGALGTFENEKKGDREVVFLAAMAIKLETKYRRIQLSLEAEKQRMADIGRERHLSAAEQEHTKTLRKLDRLITHGIRLLDQKGDQLSDRILKQGDASATERFEVINDRESMELAPKVALLKQRIDIQLDRREGLFDRVMDTEMEELRGRLAVKPSDITQADNWLNPDKTEIYNEEILISLGEFEGYLRSDNIKIEEFLSGRSGREKIREQQEIYAIWNGLADSIVRDHLKLDWDKLEAAGVLTIPPTNLEAKPPTDGTIVEREQFQNLYRARLEHLMPHLNPETLQQYFDEGRLIEILLAVSRHHSSYRESGESYMSVDRQYQRATEEFRKDMGELKPAIEYVNGLKTEAEVGKQLRSFRNFFSSEVWNQLQSCSLSECKQVLKFCYVENYIRKGTRKNSHSLHYKRNHHFGNVMLDRTGDCNAFSAYYLSVISALQDPDLTQMVRISNPKGHIQLGFLSENIKFIKNASAISSAYGEGAKFRSLEEELGGTDLIAWDEDSFVPELTHIVGAELAEIDASWDKWTDLSPEEQTYYRYIKIKALALEPGDPTTFRNASAFIFDDFPRIKLTPEQEKHFTDKVIEMGHLDFSMSENMANYVTGAYSTLSQASRERIREAHKAYFGRPKVRARVQEIVRDGLDQDRRNQPDVDWINAYEGLDVLGQYNPQTREAIMEALIGTTANPAQARQRRENLVAVAAIHYTVRSQKPTLVGLAGKYKWFGNAFDYRDEDVVWSKIKSEFPDPLTRGEKYREVKDFVERVESFDPDDEALDWGMIRRNVGEYKDLLNRYRPVYSPEVELSNRLNDLELPNPKPPRLDPGAFTRPNPPQTIPKPKPPESTPATPELISQSDLKQLLAGRINVRGSRTVLSASIAPDRRSTTFNLRVKIEADGLGAFFGANKPGRHTKTKVKKCWEQLSANSGMRSLVQNGLIQSISQSDVRMVHDAGDYATFGITLRPASGQTIESVCEKLKQ